jgi:heat shock protein HslJ
MEPTLPVQDVEIIDVLWLWSELIENQPSAQSLVPNPESYTLVFHADGRLSVQADCNMVNGSYQYDGAGLNIQLDTSTRAFCGEDSLDHQYLSLLPTMVSGGPDGSGGLALESAGGAERMVFANGGLAGEPQQPPPPLIPGEIVDTIWGWIELIETVSATQSVIPNPENYTLVFHTDGQLSVRADCNMVSGSYTIDGNRLTIQLGASTMAFCGENSLDQQYLTLLGNMVTGGTYDAGGLALESAGGAERMVFANGGSAIEVELPITPPSPGEEIFSDDFSTDKGWFTGETESGAFEYTDGGYQITNKIVEANIWSVRSLEVEDVIQEVSVTWIAGPSDGFYGVLCRFQDRSNYYTLAIGKDGFYGIGKMEANLFRFLVEGIDDQGIINIAEGGQNKVRGDCVGTTLTLYVNDRRMLVVEDSGFGSGQIGLLNGTQTKPNQVVLYDNYAVLEP